MKIAVTGTRGIPAIQGGVETHCEHLFPRIAAMGAEVTLMRRDSYVNESPRLSDFKGVGLIDIPTPRRKSLEAIVHTFRAINRAKRMKADIVHIHAIGPALLTPYGRLLGMKVVTTHHGPDYDREKWGRVAKFMLRLGERMGARFSNRVIVISPLIASILKEKYGRNDTDLIFNGVERPQRAEADDYVRSLGLEPGKYVVALGRFVPEKNFHHLIEAFSRISHPGIKLAIAGDADIEDSYSRSLKQMAHDNGVMLTGFIKGEKLRQLMSHARLFVLPSSHEGLPISLLEAMSYGIDVLVSDIPANRLPELSAADFFHTGDISALALALTTKLEKPYSPRAYDLSNYDWDRIALQTMEVYRSLMG